MAVDVVEAVAVMYWSTLIRLLVIFVHFKDVLCTHHVDLQRRGSPHIGTAAALTA